MPEIPASDYRIFSKGPRYPDRNLESPCYHMMAGTGKCPSFPSANIMLYLYLSLLITRLSLCEVEYDRAAKQALCITLM
jgi:hypothetical protein